MKKIILLTTLSFLFSVGHSQYSLTFCESVTADGNPQKLSNSFMVTGKGSALTLFMKADTGFDSDQLKFNIYFINTLGNEEEVTSLTQKAEPGWNYVWKEVVLFNPGVYRVKVYSGKGTYLTSANLNIKNP